MLLKISILLMLATHSGSSIGSNESSKATNESSTATNESSIYTFTKQSKLDNWMILNDVVMGGQSLSSFGLNDQGHGVFQGQVSLENNGGFASLWYRFEKSDVKSFNSIAIRLKGDGLNYQFRLKSKKYDKQSYVHNFQTSGEWEWIHIPLSEMYPTWRGRTLQMPGYPGQTMEEIAILIGNKKPEEFRLEIDQIVLK
jgi:hypothetical protein